MTWTAETEQSLKPNQLILGKTLGDAFTGFSDEISLSKKGYHHEYGRLNKFIRHVQK